MPNISVHDFLKTSLPDVANSAPFSVAVVFGDDAFLKSQAVKKLRHDILAGDDAEFSFSRHDGSSVLFNTVIKDVTTQAMFGSGKRLVLVEDADKFVTTYRADLEKWVEKSASSATTNGVLLLVLQSFAANTKLYKMVSQAGLMIEAKAVAEKDIPKWIIGWAKNVHRVKCDADAAELLCQHVGAEHGLLDQELAKLALSVPPKGSITQALVEEAVGTWRSRSTFEMLDLALAGKTEEAIRQLRLLFAAGENEIGILAQMAYSLRKLGAATNLILASENAASNKSRDKISVTKALEQSGVTNNWQKSKLELQLKQLGRHRGQRLSSWLLEADLDLKGASRRDGQLVMETLIVKISASQLKDRGAVPPTT